MLKPTRRILYHKSLKDAIIQCLELETAHSAILPMIVEIDIIPSLSELESSQIIRAILYQVNIYIFYIASISTNVI